MGGLFKSDTPKPATPARMPDEEDPAVIEARRRAAEASRARSGRASTMLSNRNQRAQGQAGTQAYGHSLLGQAG